MDNLASLIESVAAEAREPVLSALAAVEQLRRLRLPDGAEACLDAISEANASALSLIEVAGEIQSHAARRFVLAPQSQRLQELMDEVEARWRGRAERAGVTLLASYDGDPDCAAMVDAPRLLQVFDALIGHALAHVRNGVVEASLKARAGDGGVTVSGSVRDNGAFYTAAYLAELFEANAVAD